MSTSVPIHLILTVGTGTAGRHANLAGGLRRTLELVRPATFRLLPSSNADSIATADLVRENLPGFTPCGPAGFPYRLIEHPDDLEYCRQVIRQVIQDTRKVLCPGERIVVNPTSGTKSMTSGATLAALDEGIARLDFTAGERADGVVVTGRERIVSFQAERSFADRDLAAARHLAGKGHWAAAAWLLHRSGPLLEREAALADMVALWSRHDYAHAVESAEMTGGRVPPHVVTHLRRLAAEVHQKLPTPLGIADLLFWSREAIRCGEAERALMLANKALEYAARERLRSEHDLKPPFGAEQLLRLPLSDSTRNKLKQAGNFVSLFLMIAILDDLQDPFAAAFRADHRIRTLIGLRNEHMHDLRPVHTSAAQALHDRVRAIVTAATILPGVPSLPTL